MILKSFNHLFDKVHGKTYLQLQQPMILKSFNHLFDKVHGSIISNLCSWDRDAKVIDMYFYK